MTWPGSNGPTATGRHPGVVADGDGDLRSLRGDSSKLSVSCRNGPALNSSRRAHRAGFPLFQRCARFRVAHVTLPQSALSLLRVPAVVRGGVEPPTFRFSEGLASPGESTTDRLTRPYDVLAALGVQDQPHVSTAVVSRALASPA
jgi:hypothetical protein